MLLLACVWWYVSHKSESDNDLGQNTVTVNSAKINQTSALPNIRRKPSAKKASAGVSLRQELNNQHNALSVKQAQPYENHKQGN